MKIWLDSNIHTHSFIPEDCWKIIFQMMIGVLTQAEEYVYSALIDELREV